MLQASVVMSRGKKRMGYELELKVKLAGRGRWEGLEASVELTELCDDGSDPEHKIYIQKESSKGSGPKFREEARSERLAKQLTERCRDVLNIVRDEA